MTQALLQYECAKGRVLVQIMKALGVTVAGRRVLEVGCSTGALMELVQALGADVFGIDVPSSWSSNYSFDPSRRIICDLQTESGREVALKLRRFDVILAQEVIEHIQRPYDFLLSLRELLLPRGLLLLTTPNLNGLTAIFCNEKWCGVATEGHALLYSRKSLDFVLRNCGFQKVRVLTNLIPIVHQDGRPILVFLNRLFWRTGLGGGIVALYKKPESDLPA